MDSVFLVGIRNERGQTTQRKMSTGVVLSLTRVRSLSGALRRYVFLLPSIPPCLGNERHNSFTQQHNLAVFGISIHLDPL